MNKKLIKIFVVYARPDLSAIHELKNHFNPVVEKHKLRLWYDGEILPGQEWDKTVKDNLRNSDIVLLVISSSFFASDYIKNIELKLALDRYKRREIEIIPVILRPCVWQEHLVGKFQALPEGGNPVFSKHWNHSDDAFVSIVHGVISVLPKIRARQDQKKRLFTELCLNFRKIVSESFLMVQS